MNTASLALLTGGLVCAANVIDGKGLSARQVVGTGVYAIGLAVANESAPTVAPKFAALVLIGVLFVQLPKIVNGLGLAS